MDLPQAVHPTSVKPRNPEFDDYFITTEASILDLSPFLPLVPVSSPVPAARAKSQGEYIDPLTNMIVKTTETLAADHIFPKALVKELPGFKMLTPAQQSEALNNLENFRGLPQSQNSSKGSRIDWEKYKSQSLDAQYAKELAALQQIMKIELQAQIDALLASPK